MTKNAFECHGDVFDHWSIGWSSTSDIFYNKRWFHLSMSTGELTIGVEPFFGIPSAQRVIDILYRKMTYTRTEPFPPMDCMKPRTMCLSFRMENMFHDIERAMSAVGIECYLESERDTRFNCEVMGTRFDGMNHLMEREKL